MYPVLCSQVSFGLCHNAARQGSVAHLTEGKVAARSATGPSVALPSAAPGFTPRSVRTPGSCGWCFLVSKSLCGPGGPTREGGPWKEGAPVPGFDFATGCCGTWGASPLGPYNPMYEMGRDAVSGGVEGSSLCSQRIPGVRPCDVRPCPVPVHTLALCPAPCPHPRLLAAVHSAWALQATLL